jgi:putative tryptophan/tyrosine transport system substrate-binding protein
MKRREFIRLLGVAAATAWPMASRAQQAAGMRHIGVLMSNPETDAEVRARYAAFLQRLGQLGWTEGRNLRIDLRWGAADPGHARTLAAGLLRDSPELVTRTEGRGDHR